ncbi:MAG: glutaredoxin 3 [Alphaproteobacteria bacterium]|nr:glutaredoxin 3 [Alphaproteobacteria bacterium]
MAFVEVYMRPMCGFCHAAKRLLDSKGVSYVEYNIWEQDGKQAEMSKRSHGGRTVPQIFIDDIHIGGCDDLMRLDKSGKLDPMLG